jgi:hypothetical protein
MERIIRVLVGDSEGSAPEHEEVHSETVPAAEFLNEGAGCGGNGWGSRGRNQSCNRLPERKSAEVGCTDQVFVRDKRIQNPVCGCLGHLQGIRDLFGRCPGAEPCNDFQDPERV